MTLLAQRNSLMNSIKRALTDSSTDENAITAMMNQVDDIDAQIDNAATVLDSRGTTNLQNKSEDVKGAKIMTTNNSGKITFINAWSKKVAGFDLTEEDNKVINASYTNAWAKKMKGVNLSEEDNNIVNSVNAEFANAAGDGFTHTTGNTPLLIPNTVVAGIIGLAEEAYPFFGATKKFNVRGTLTFNKHTAIKNGDADWYDEDTETADEEDEFGVLKLEGKELSKVAPISWKLKAMAVGDFIDFITKELADRIGVALGTGAIHGDGVKQMLGAVTALNKEVGTPQVVTGDITYANLRKLISKVHSAYTSASAIYVNNQTIWNELAAIVDGNGRPMFITDPAENGIGKLFGFNVVADAGLKDNEILFGSASQFVVNTNEALSITTEDHVKARKTDYAAYTVIDGGLLDNKALAVLTAGTTTPTA